MDHDSYLTVSEAAELLRVNEETVRRWVRAGRLQAVMPGGRKAGYRISERLVRAMLSGDQADKRSE
jgi:excisionase family DNA binding protein